MKFQRNLLNLWNKRGVKLLTSWVELVTLAILIFGFILALLAGSAVMSYIIIFFCGMVTGRNFFIRRNRAKKLHYFVIIFGFIVGYVVGSYYGQYQVTLLMFIIGNILSYYLHSLGYVHAY